MKKKIAFLLVCVFCLTFALSGCDLFVLDYNKYLSQTIATVNYPTQNGITNTIVITKEDLIQSYNKYGENLTQNGYTTQTAVEYLVQYLINQKIMLNEVEALIESDKIVLTNNDYNNMWTQTYEGMISLLADYEEEIISDWKLTTPSVLTEDAEDTNTYFKPFEKQAELVKDTDGNWHIKTIVNPEEENEDLIYTAIGKEVETIITALTQKIGDNAVLVEAKKRYIADLKTYEKGKNLSTINNEIFAREVERVYTNVKNNIYLSLYSEYFENKTGYSPISVEQVLNYLTADMLASYTEYKITPDAYKTDILSSRADAKYVMDDNYFYVSHILIKFTDEQTSKLEDLKTKLEQGAISSSVYNTERQKIVDSTLAKEYGETTNITASTLLNNLKDELLQTTSDADKVDIFNEYIYKYNEDTGNKNQTYDYVIGTTDSKMVESFTQSARELYNNGGGSFGDISDLVESEYGLHIVIYLNPVTNAFTITNASTFNLLTLNQDDLDEIIYTINTTKLSLLNTKTIFDNVYETLFKDNFSKFEAMHLNTLKENLTIKLYSTNYSDLY